MATVLDETIEAIHGIQRDARSAGDTIRRRWPMIVLRSPKGWTGPKEVDGQEIEGTFRAHQVPLLVDDQHPGHMEQLESWMRSYKPEELFDASGRLLPDLAALAPKGNGGWAPTRTPTAGCCCVICGCPTSAPTRWR